MSRFTSALRLSVPVVRLDGNTKILTPIKINWLDESVIFKNLLSYLKINHNGAPERTDGVERHMNIKEMITRAVRIRSEIVMLVQVLPEPLANATEYLIPFFDELIEKLKEIK